MREAVIVSAARTPVGRCRGVLAPVRAFELGAVAIKEAVKRAGINPKDIDEVIFGNLMNNDTNNISRVASLAAGLPVTVPCITVDRQCGSSLNAFAYAAVLIESGYADTIVAGGVESDSNRPYIMDRAKQAYQNTPPAWAEIIGAPAEIGNPPMIVTAENVAEKYGISRKECDEFSVLSHQKAAKAWASGYFNSQVVPVTVPQGKGKTITVSMDEAVRADCNVETLAKLPSVVKPGGVVTAGNSSPQSDGAGAVVVMEKEKAKALRLPIMAKFKSYASAGVDPSIMGIGPIAATKKLFDKTGMTLKDIDLIELNEAFAAQSIACVREMDIDMEKFNVNGGAVALGHPLGGTGAILLTKMIYELERRNLQTGLVTFCCGGGLGVSVVIERI